MQKSSQSAQSAQLVWSEEHVFQNYKRTPVAFSHGQGCRLWDQQGREYLDFVGGIAVSSLGHAHPRLVEAISQQAARYLHVSNLYQIPEQAQAARLLVEASRDHGARGLDRVFFANSGAEANEAAIKLARKWGKSRSSGDGPAPYEILVTHNSFHGRTLATVAATGTPRYHQGFEPMPPGFRFVPFNDLEAAAEALATQGESVCALLVEPIQGEAGVIPGSGEYLQGLERLCREHGLLFILDEIQTGIGRTGKMFAFHHHGLEPDLVTVAKGLGGGVPVGALLAKEEVAAKLVPGDHGTTFGGNPLAMSAVSAVLETLAQDRLCENVTRVGGRLIAGLEKLAAVEEVRGTGLLVAADLKTEAAPVVAGCLERGLLVNPVRPKTLRFAPPLIVSEGEVDRALEIVEEVLALVAQPAPV